MRPDPHPLDDPRAYARWGSLHPARHLAVIEEVGAGLRGAAWPSIVAAGPAIDVRAIPHAPPVQHHLAAALARLCYWSTVDRQLPPGLLEDLAGLLVRYSLAGHDQPRVEAPPGLLHVEAQLQAIADEAAYRVHLARRAGDW